MNNPNGADKIILQQEKVKVPSHGNFYNLSYRFAQSEKFGEVSPFFRYHGVERDKNVLLHSVSTIDSMSLHAPILQSIRRNKDFYMVDMHAILPRTWDFIKSLPERGDDIDAQLANCLIRFYNDDYSEGLAVTLRRLAHQVSFYDYVNDVMLSDAYNRFFYFCKFFALFDCLFSRSSLFAEFRIPLADFCSKDSGEAISSFLSDCWRFYHDILISYSTTATSPFFVIDFADSEGNTIYSKRYDSSSVSDRVQFIYDIIENPSFNNHDPNVGGLIFTNLASVFSGIDWFNYDSDSSDLGMRSVFANNSNVNDLILLFPTNDDSLNLTKPLNIDVIIAYQLCCYEYFTNDHVDYCYGADLYRQLFEGFDASYFSYNGVDYPYDGFSAVCLSNLINNLSIAGNIISFSLFMSLISRKRSLRHRDYFTGSRTTPLAIGDNGVQVNDNVASVIDITQKIQLVRLRMAVQRVGRKAKNYINKILGGDYRTRIDIPIKIGHISESLYQEVTQNTAEDQLNIDNSRTSVLKSSNNRFAFETDIDQDTIIIGVSSYDVDRFYDRGLDPFALKVDRFDMFIPEMQYIGDQPLSRSEINAGYTEDLPFAYVPRHQEYKVGIDYCCGAFRDELKGWIFSQHYDGLINSADTFLNPSFIRSAQYELDPYYVALTGTTSDKRYHFICKYRNSLSAIRNMVINPQILR